MKNLLCAFLLAASLAICVGCGPSGTPGQAYPYAAEWTEFETAKKEKNQQMQIDALQKIVDKDPNAMSPNGQLVKTLLEFAKDGKLVK